MHGLPNAISTLRALSVVLVVALLALDAVAAALVVFAVAALTDALDGALARRMGATSRLGTLLDPLADTVLVVGTLGGLLVYAAVPAVPVVTILVRAVVVTGLRAAAAGRGVSVPSNVFGKAKAMVEGTAVAAQLAALTWPDLGLTPAADALLWVAATATVATGVDVAQRASTALASHHRRVRLHAR